MPMQRQVSTLALRIQHRNAHPTPATQPAHSGGTSQLADVLRVPTLALGSHMHGRCRTNT